MEKHDLLDVIQQKKQEAKHIASIISHHYRRLKTEDAQKLRDCTRQIAINLNTRKITRLYPCGSRFCPLCKHFKIRKEIAKTYRLYEKINQNDLYNKYRFYYLTLTVKDCTISQLSNTITLLNQGFERLRNTKPWENVVVGASKYMHFGLNGNSRVQPHLHVIILVKPSYTSTNRITNEKWKLLWSEATGGNYDANVECKSLGLRGRAATRDLVNAVAYSFNSFKLEDIKEHPRTYIETMSQIKHRHKSSHSGVIARLRRQIKQEHSAHSTQEDLESTITMEFNGEEYVEIQSQTI